MENKLRFHDCEEMYETISSDFTGIAHITDENITYHFKNGQYHREDGPAIFSNFQQQWYINGILVKEENVELNIVVKLYTIESSHRSKSDFQDFIRRLYNQYVLEKKQ